MAVPSHSPPYLNQLTPLNPAPDIKKKFFFGEKHPYGYMIFSYVLYTPRLQIDYINVQNRAPITDYVPQPT